MLMLVLLSGKLQNVIRFTYFKLVCAHCMSRIWGSLPRGYKTFFKLSSAETKIYPAHKCLNANNYRLWQSEPEILTSFGYFRNYEQFKFHAQLS